MRLILVVATLLVAGCAMQRRVQRPIVAPVRVVPVEDAAPAVPPPAPAPRAAAEPAGIGVLAPLSGRYAAFGREFLDGATLAMEAFAARGPIRARVVPADSKGEPVAALAAVRRLVEDETVVAVQGDLLSMPTLAAAIEANCHGMPFVSNVAAEPGIGAVGPYVFHWAPSRLAAARATAEFVLFELRHFRAALLSSEDGEGRELGRAFAERFAELGGEIVFAATPAPGTTDFAPVARRIAAALPDVLYAPASADELLLLLPALGVVGTAFCVAGTEDLGSERVLAGAGLDLEGAVFPVVEPAALASERERFRALHAARFDTEANRFVLAGYLAASRILDALALSTSGDRASVQRALADRAPIAAGPRFLVVRDGVPQPAAAP